MKKDTGIKDKTKLIQCTQDDGSSFFFAHGDGRIANIKLIDKHNIYRNKFQVINVVNIDYILALVAKYQKERHKNKKIPVDIFRAINSNLELRPKKELIEMFIKQLDNTEDNYETWIKFRDEQKAKELAQIVARENLKMPETKDLIYTAIQNGHFNITDAEIAEILPPISRFGGGIDTRLAKKRYIYELLNHFFMKYHY